MGTSNDKKLYKLKNWIRERKTQFGKYDKEVADGWAKEQLTEWIADYGISAVIKAWDSSPVCYTLKDFEKHINFWETELKDRPKRLEKAREHIKQYTS